MKKHFKFLPFLFLALCLLLNSCSPEEPVNNSRIQNDKLSTDYVLKSNLNYLTNEEADIAAQLLISSFNDFSSNMIDSTKSVSQYKKEFFQDNQDVPADILAYVDQNIDNSNTNQSYEPIFVTHRDIQTSEYLNEIQKEYAIRLMDASMNENMNELYQIREDYLFDSSTHPELQIFSLGIALIGQKQFSAKSNDCREDALDAAIFMGVTQMVGGAVIGGAFGFTIGFFGAGVLSVPGGMIGVVVGGVGGGVLGFAEGYIGGWLWCKFKQIWD